MKKIIWYLLIITLTVSVACAEKLVESISSIQVYNGSTRAYTNSIRVIPLSGIQRARYKAYSGETAIVERYYDDYGVADVNSGNTIIIKGN